MSELYFAGSKLGWMTKSWWYMSQASQIELAQFAEVLACLWDATKTNFTTKVTTRPAS